MGFLAHLELKPTLKDRIKEAQKGNEGIEGIKSRMSTGEVPGFSVDEKEPYGTTDALCVPQIQN